MRIFTIVVSSGEILLQKDLHSTHNLMCVPYSRKLLKITSRIKL